MVVLVDVRREPKILEVQSLGEQMNQAKKVREAEKAVDEKAVDEKAREAEKIRETIAREMREIRKFFAFRTFTTRDYFPAEFNAEIEANNAKLIKDKELKEAAAKAKADDEAAAKAAAKAKAEDEAREFESEKADWIKEHGSDYLKLAHKEKYNCLRLYATERAALEFPGFEVVKRGSFKKCCCPIESALRESVALTAAYKLPVRVVWHNNAEALLIRNFLGGRYDLMKLPR